MRTTMSVLVLGAALLSLPATSAAAAQGVPQRPDGPVVPVQSSVNGGDNGWGNCGHNSSGGNPHTGFNGNGGGNGGYEKGEGCGTTDPTDPTDPPIPTDPTDPGGPVAT